MKRHNLNSDILVWFIFGVMFAIIGILMATAPM